MFDEPFNFFFFIFEIVGFENHFGSPVCKAGDGGTYKLVGLTSSDQVGLCSCHQDAHMLASMNLL